MILWRCSERLRQEPRFKWFTTSAPHTPHDYGSCLYFEHHRTEHSTTNTHTYMTFSITVRHEEHNMITALHSNNPNPLIPLNSTLPNHSNKYNGNVDPTATANSHDPLHGTRTGVHGSGRHNTNNV